MLLTQTHSITWINHKHNPVACFEVMLPQIPVSTDPSHIKSRKGNTLIWNIEMVKID